MGLDVDRVFDDDSNDDSNNFNEWVGIIEEQGKRHRQQIKKYLSKLGKPNHIESHGDYQYGYWKAVGGVFRMTRWGEDRPWDPFSRVEFNNGEITILNRVSSG
jgi:hypothetical protein